MAQEIAERFNQYFPDHAESHFTLGEVWVSIGQRDKALLAYQKAADLQPDNEKYKHMVQQLSHPPTTGTEFVLSGYTSAQIVSVVGSFNDWDKTANLCHWKNASLFQR